MKVGRKIDNTASSIVLEKEREIKKEGTMKGTGDPL